MRIKPSTFAYNNLKGIYPKRRIYKRMILGYKTKCCMKRLRWFYTTLRTKKIIKVRNIQHKLSYDQRVICELYGIPPILIKPD